MLSIAFFTVFALALLFFYLASQKSAAIAGDNPASMHSRPSYHGLFVALRILMIGWAIVLFSATALDYIIDRALMLRIAAALPDMPGIRHQLVLSDAKALALGAVASATDTLREAIAADFARYNGIRIWGTLIAALAASGLIGYFHIQRITLDFRARNRAEAIIRHILLACATIAILTTVGIVLSLIFETLNFFGQIGWRLDKYLFGTTWSPLSGVHDGNMDADKVGVIPLFLGTFLITLIAMVVAVPIGLFSAIYLSDFASPKVRGWAKPMLELLAGIPTVVYGFFAAITIAPALRSFGETVGLSIASESALAAGLVMGIMIIPFISSLSDDVINAVPQALRDGSYGLGATKAETMRKVVLPAALPGIVSAVLLGMSRAIGETMIVVMAAGQGANLTFNPLEAVTTVTVQIVMLITGDTDAATAAGPAFTLGFTLFCVTLGMNVLALRLVRKYREAYD